MMVSKSPKRAMSLAVIYGIVLVLYILSFWMIPFHKSSTSLISFVFTILSIAMSLVACGYALNYKKTTDVFYGIPIFRVGFLYMAVQLAAGIAFCIVSSLISVPYWIPTLTYVLMLGTVIILLIVIGNTRDVIVEIEDTSTEKTRTFSTFNIDVEGIWDLCEDDNLKILLQNICDTFKYSSDPVSNDATKDVETDIEKELKDLRELVLNSNIEMAMHKATTVQRLLDERNRICKTHKK